MNTAVITTACRPLAGFHDGAEASCMPAKRLHGTRCMPHMKRSGSITRFHIQTDSLASIKQSRFSRACVAPKSAFITT
jgi:hypothetical protein